MNSLYKFSIIIGLIVFPSVISAQRGNVNEYLNIPDSMLQIKNSSIMVWRPGLGLIAESEIPEGWMVDVEGLLTRVATLPTAETLEDLNYYYANYAIFLEPEQRRREAEEMRQLARRLKSQRLADESRFLDAFNGHGDDYAEIIDPYWQVVRQFEKEGKHIFALKLKLDLFNKARLNGGDHYYRSFLMAEELLVDVEKVTEDEFPLRRQVYSEVGHLYYNFRDYDAAVPLLEKALTDKSVYYFDHTNLRARNTLAVYYNTVGDTEKSAYYFRSILDSPDRTYNRAMFSAIALTGLGRIAAEHEDCRYAIKLFRAALPVPPDFNDHNYAVGIMASMGKCYLKLGETGKARDMIDSMRLYIHDPDVWVSPHRNRELYSLLSKYYMYKGDVAMSEVYVDSTALAEKEYQDEFSDQVILKARQEIYEAQKKMRDEKIYASQNYIIGLAVILALIAAIAVMVILNSRRLRKKNRSLFERMKDYNMQEKEINRLRALLPPPPSGENSSGKEDNDENLYALLSQLMEDPEVYSDKKLTRKSLADMLFTNEIYLRRTITQQAGLTFNEYITGVRLNHARRFLLSTDPKYTSQEITSACGFGGVSTFYRLFKNYYGMTPDQFRHSANEI